MNRNRINKVGLLLSFLLIFQLIFPAITFASNPPESWMLILGKLIYGETFILGPTRDGGQMIAVAYFAATRGDQSKEHLIKIMKLNSGGEIESEINTSVVGRVHAIIALEKGGYLLVGAGHWEDGKEELLLARITADGEKLWEKRFETNMPYWETILAAAAANDGGYLAVFPERVPGGEYQSFRVVKFDENGSWLWDRVYDEIKIEHWLKNPETGEVITWYTYQKGKYAEPKKVVKSSDGGYLVAGIGTADALTMPGWISKMDDRGNEVWSRTFGKQKIDEIQEVLAEEDGGSIIVGTQRKKGSVFKEELWVARLDQNGNILLEVSHDLHGGRTKQIIVNDLARTKGGGYVLAGVISGNLTFTNKNKAWVRKLDRKLETEWYKKFGIDGYIEATDISQASDGGYLLTGYYGGESQFAELFRKKGLRVFWILKLDKDGKIKAPKYYIIKLKESHHFILMPLRVILVPLLFIIGGP